MVTFFFALLVGITLSQTATLVPVNFYVMSKCPYAAFLVDQFNQNTMSAQGISGIINITFNFIAAVDSTQPTGFYSKHGQSEVQGDFYELCVNSVAPLGLWNFVVCADQDRTSIPNNMQACGQQGGINWNRVQVCYNTDSTPLLKASIRQTDSLGITTSPTLFINGQCVYGGLSSCTNLDPSSNMMLQAICSAWTGIKPKGCSSLE